MSGTVSAHDFDKALAIGRPPNISRLFPSSKALIVSGKVVDRALRAKGQAMTIAANCRNTLVVRGVLRAAQRANAAILVEIAKSEGGRNAYTAVNYWNLATQVDAAANELGITVPIAVHADHYGLKGQKDIPAARAEIPSLFDAGITSIAIDASHMPEAENLLTSIELHQLVPAWAGYETEVGEIKGKEGLSTPEEALFLIRGLNANGIFPDWIALNNGTTHGIQTEEHGIMVELTKEIHQALTPYEVSGAQHGTSGNDSARLRRIARETRTTKANVATALQMVSWGVQVDEFGNAALDDNGILVKVPGAGIRDDLWAEMMAYAAKQGWKSGNLKSLCLPFDNKILAQPREVREAMAKAVEDFVYTLLTEVFFAQDSAPLAVEAILEAGSFDPGTRARRIEDPAEWTQQKIIEKARLLEPDTGTGGDFDD
jgi:fructose/tagatose bisphosphate aldolase